MKRSNLPLISIRKLHFSTWVDGVVGYRICLTNRILFEPGLTHMTVCGWKFLSACTVVIPLLSAELMYLQSPHLKDAIEGGERDFAFVNRI